MSFKLTIGRVGFAAVDLFPNEAIVGIEPSTAELDARYLALWLSSQDLSAGSGRAVKGNTLNGQSLRSILVEFPPLAEQKRIVDLVQNLDVYASSAQETADFASETERRLVSTFIDQGPVEWETMRLGEAVEVVMGRQRSPKHATGANVLPYLRAANVQDGLLDLADVKKMNFSPGEQERYRLVEGDVLVTEGCGSIAQLGASARWSASMSGTVCFQNTLLRLRARPGVTIPGYVELLARHAHHSGQWAAVASGTNIFHIGATRASEIPVRVPPVRGQEKIVSLVEALQASSRSALEAAQAASQLRGVVLSDLLVGPHRIPDSYDELLTEAV